MPTLCGPVRQDDPRNACKPCLLLLYHQRRQMFRRYASDARSVSLQGLPCSGAGAVSASAHFGGRADSSACAGVYRSQNAVSREHCRFFWQLEPQDRLYHPPSSCAQGANEIQEGLGSSACHCHQAVARRATGHPSGVYRVPGHHTGKVSLFVDAGYRNDGSGHVRRAGAEDVRRPEVQ